MTSLLLSAFIYLASAAVAVPLSKRLGLGSVLGYLIAGVLIGPVFGLVGQETESIQHVAEFGVVMMLFLVGLELEPHKLWQLRWQLLGLGGLQVVLTIAAITGIAMLMGLSWTVGVAAGGFTCTPAVLFRTLGCGVQQTDNGGVTRITDAVGQGADILWHSDAGGQAKHVFRQLHHAAQ